MSDLGGARDRDLRDFLRNSVEHFSFASRVNRQRLSFEVGSFQVHARVHKGRPESGHRYRDVELAYFPKGAVTTASPGYVYSQVFGRVLRTSKASDAELYDILDDEQFRLLKSDIRDLTEGFAATYDDEDKLFWGIFEGRVPSEACLSRDANKPLLLKNAAEFALAFSRGDLLGIAKSALLCGPWGREEAEASELFLEDLEDRT